MGAVVTITQTDTGWVVVATDAAKLEVEIVGNECVVDINAPETQPLDVTLANG